MLVVKQHQGRPSFYVVGHYEYQFVCWQHELYLCNKSELYSVNY